MANVWFSADFHFGHSNIIRCDRPFASAAEMDEAILDRVNESVKSDDELYFLGDFCIGGPKIAAAYRQKIRCKKVYFILGNHDRAIKKIVDVGVDTNAFRPYSFDEIRAKLPNPLTAAHLIFKARRR